MSLRHIISQRLPVPAHLHSALARSSHSLAIVKNKAFIFGGEFQARIPVDANLYVYDLEAVFAFGVLKAKDVVKSVKVLSPTENTPAPRVGATMSAIGSKIYLFGGRGGKEMTPLQSELYAFDTETTTWQVVEAKSGELPAPRSFHAMTASDSDIYVFGGCPVKGRLNDLHRFSLSSGAWSTLPTPPITPRGGAAMTYHGNRLYIHGGFTGREESDLVVYDTLTGEWAQASPLSSADGPRARSVHAIVPVASESADFDRLLILFGEGRPSDLGHEGAGEFWGDVWTATVPKSSLKSGLSVAYEKLTLAAAAAEQNAQDNLPCARGWFQALPWNVVSASTATSSSMASSSIQNPPATLPEGYVMAPSGAYADFTKTIEKSLNDDRDYRLLRLNNELEVLLIHDPNVDKSAAALDVHVGHLSDPKNLQGLAHFLEHLLFMGTAKYPRENEYSEYLAQHAGMSNAFTNLDNTNYYFEVGHAHLEGALDRFAQFFISPAFSENCKDRELRAVDSEHKKNLQSDTWRLFQLGKNMSSPHHPYHQFGTGNLETLQDNPAKEGIDVRDELIKFHSKYYSANIMKLVILGREPLDQLASWAVEKFSPIRNLGIKPPAYPNPPWTEKELLNIAYVKPVKDVRSLQIQFPFPDQYPHYKVHPARYLTHAIGHESEGSILSLLKKRGWANGLSAGTLQGGIGFEFFKISVDLTQEGLAHYEDVTCTIFQYIDLLRQEGVRPYIWNELSQLADVSFRFKEKSQAAGYVSRLAGIMQRGYAPEWVLSGSYLIRESDPKLVMDCLGYLRKDNWRAALVAQDPSMVPGGEFTLREHYYGTEYHVEPVGESLKQRLAKLTLAPELHLPEPNAFIPTNFEVGKVPIVKPLASPILIKHSPLMRIWHKKDDTFWVPKATLIFQLRTPLAYSTPGNNVKTHLYVDLLRDALSEYSYDAEMAGLAYNLETNVDGMVLSIDGYNDKAHVLLAKVVEKMKTLEIKPERFHLLQEQLERTYKNFQLEAPYQHAMYYMSYLTQERLWTHAEKLAELQEMNAQDIQDFYPELLSRLHIEALIHGNMLTQDALQAAAIVEDVLSPKALLPAQLVPLRAHLLPQHCKAVYSRVVSDPNNVNSGIEYFVQTGDAADKAMRAKVQVLAQIVNEPCFNQLRTKEQLGYLVFSGVRRQSGAIGLRFILQSERDPVHLESRIEAFLEERLKPFLVAMTEQEYNKQVASLIQKKMEKDKNLRVETHRYWTHITSGYFEFDEIQADVEEMRKLTKEDILAFVLDAILPSGKSTRKLSVHLLSQKVPPVAAKEKEGEGEAEKETKQEPAKLREGTYMIDNLVGYKAGLELSRAPYPVVDLLKYTSPHL
ncbi:Insulinase (Peptidase M16) [Actinomortierella ambigua]|nr:Insulinase (Peptidase M16) [Actinomortierella ambigua]